MKRLLASIPFLLVAACGAPSHAQAIRGGWTICTSDLQLRDTLIERANERELTLINAYGIRSVLSMDRVLFVVKAEAPTPVAPDEVVGAPAPEPSPVRLISLVDGQRVRGSIIESGVPEELAISLITGTTIHGDASIPLERVLSIRDQLSPIERAEADLIDDLVILRNGDMVSGFIESIGPSVRVSLDDSELDLDFSLIERLHIANEPDPAEGIYLSFADREVLRAIGFDYATQGPVQVSVDPVTLGLEDSGSTDWRFDPGSLDALWLNDATQEVVALSEMEPQRVEPMGDRAWVPTPVVLDANASHPALQTIDLQSPVRVVYALPEGASRFACTLEAPIEVWTDCVARVIVDRNGRNRQVFEQRLHAEHPNAEINIELPSGTDALIIEIDPGAHGPVQDRVLMHKPRVLIAG